MITKQTAIEFAKFVVNSKLSSDDINEETLNEFMNEDFNDFEDDFEEDMDDEYNLHFGTYPGEDFF